MFLKSTRLQYILQSNAKSSRIEGLRSFDLCSLSLVYSETVSNGQIRDPQDVEARETLTHRDISQGLKKHLYQCLGEVEHRATTIFICHVYIKATPKFPTYTCFSKIAHQRLFSSHYCIITFMYLGYLEVLSSKKQGSLHGIGSKYSKEK